MVDSVIPVKQSNQYQQTTSQSSSSTNNGRNYQAQLKEAQEQNKNIWSKIEISPQFDCL